MFFVGTRRAVSEMNKTEGHKNIKAATWQLCIMNYALCIVNSEWLNEA